MKNYLIAFTILFLLNGCSSIELEAIPSSEQETQKILALGLSHEENLIRASKLDTPHMVAVVTLQLNNARNEKIQAKKDLEQSENFANRVAILDNGSKFVGAEISESLKVGILDTDIDRVSYYLEGNKKSGNGVFEHKLHLSLLYNSKQQRSYSEVSFCDKWNKCENKGHELKTISSIATNCKKDTCDFTEVMDVAISHDFLNDALNKGFSMRLISKKKTNKIVISKGYLMGYLQMVK